MQQFTDYDRITDTIMYLSSNITLEFVVVLSKKDKSGGRSFFQYETESVSRYYGVQKSHNIKRNMTFYFVLNNKNDFGNGLILRPQDVVLLILAIEQQILPWFFGKEERIFSITKDKTKLIIKGNYNPVHYIQSEHKFLKFEPIVYEYEDGTYKEGIRITINNEFVDLDIDRFMGFYYILKNTDMYTVASTMVNYVKMPPYGINVYSATGLGGGYVQDNWNETSDSNMIEEKKTQNNFLNSVPKKK